MVAGSIPACSTHTKHKKMDEIKDCYGTTLQPGDTVITHVAWGCDVKGYSTGIVKATISHLTSSGRLILKKPGQNYTTAQRFPEQVVKI